MASLLAALRASSTVSSSRSAASTTTSTPILRAFASARPRLAPPPSASSKPTTMSNLFQGFPTPPRAPAQDPDAWWSTASRRRSDGSNNDSFSGRTINVLRGNDFAKAYRQLQTLIRKTGLKKQVKASEVYEKPSEKRVRLSSERHRRRFQAMVREKVWQANLYTARK